jgi:hypothetical protein
MALGYFVVQYQTHLMIQPPDPITIDGTCSLSQQHMNAPVPFAHTRGGDFFRLIAKTGLPYSAALVMLSPMR